MNPLAQGIRDGIKLAFDGEGMITLSAAGLRKMFETTWEVAMYDGEEEPTSKHPSSGNVDALKQIFGMR